MTFFSIATISMPWSAKIAKGWSKLAELTRILVVADPFGQVIAEASVSKEETLIVECDLRRMEEVRRNWPFLRDRRTDAYRPLLERWLD